MTQITIVGEPKSGGCCLVIIFDLLWQVTKGIIMVIVTLLGIAACCGAQSSLLF